MGVRYRQNPASDANPPAITLIYGRIGSRNKMSVWHRYRSLPRNVLALSFVSLLNDISSEIIYPVLPAFLALSLGASPFAIGLIEVLPNR